MTTELREYPLLPLVSPYRHRLAHNHRRLATTSTAPEDWPHTPFTFEADQPPKQLQSNNQRNN